MRRLLVIDASSFIYRAFYVSPKMTNAAGLPVGAISGFAYMMIRVMSSRVFSNYHDHAVVIFDAPVQNFRHKIFKEYKAGRVRDDALVAQMPYCRDIVRALSVAQIEVSGYEADDVIAAYAAQLPLDARMTIASPDKDLMQMMQPGYIDVYDTMAKPARMRTPADIERLFGPGLTPRQIVDVQSLCGDKVDNIPGIAGIGEKTASALVAKFGSLEGVIAAPAEEMPSPRIARMVAEGADLARLSYKLVRLDTSLDTIDINAFKRNPVEGRLICNLMLDLGLQSVAYHAANEYGVDL